MEKSVQTHDNPRHPLHKLVKRPFEDENRLLLRSLIVLLSAAVIINASYVVSRMTRTAVVLPGAVLGSGSVAETDALSVSVSSISESNVPDPAFTLDDNETMLILTLHVKNNTKLTQDFIPTSALYVRTRSGDYRPLHPSMAVTKPIAGGKIAPGATLNGQVSFSVPKQATDPLLYVDPGWGNQVPVVFHVLK